MDEPRATDDREVSHIGCTKFIEAMKFKELMDLNSNQDYSRDL
jgi:hypothetical protein